MLLCLITRTLGHRLRGYRSLAEPRTGSRVLADEDSALNICADEEIRHQLLKKAQSGASWNTER